MKIKRFISLIIAIGLLFGLSFAKSEVLSIDKESRINQVFPVGYAYHYDNDSKELLTEADERNSFSPTMVQNGDILYFMAFADSEAINYYNLEVPNFGIAQISINIEKMDVCGTCVIKSMTNGFVDYDGASCLYRITDFEDGFYRVTINAKSVADGLSTSTWLSTDEGGTKEYYFKVGDVGDIVPHKD